MKWPAVSKMKTEYATVLKPQNDAVTPMWVDLAKIDLALPEAHWLICETYMKHGYLPPLDCCDLPPLEGPAFTRTKQWVLAGCIETCRLAIQELEDLQKKLKGTRRQSRQGRKQGTGNH